MKKSNLFYEIMLHTDCSAYSKEPCIKNDSEEYKVLTHSQKLEMACWNGLLPELLFAVAKPPACKVYLLHTRAGSRFLHIELASAEPDFEKVYSINSAYFIDKRRLN